MKIIISPAKKMNICNDDLSFKDMPIFINEAENLLRELKSYDFQRLKSLLACNEEIATLNFERYKYMDLYKNLTPAILSYDGIQYKYMSPNSFTDSEFNYIQRHLKILSGFYGILSPFDGIVPYRLEMQAKINIDNKKNLYGYWKDKLYSQLTKEDNIILNLASKEYSKIIEKYLVNKDTFITCIFGSLVNNKIKVKATEAKMARGAMVRYLAVNNINNIEEVKEFKDFGFVYSQELSKENEFVFIKRA